MRNAIILSLLTGLVCSVADRRFVEFKDQTELAKRSEVSNPAKNKAPSDRNFFMSNYKNTVVRKPKRSPSIPLKKGEELIFPPFLEGLGDLNQYPAEPGPNNGRLPDDCGGGAGLSYPDSTGAAGGNTGGAAQAAGFATQGSTGLQESGLITQGSRAAIAPILPSKSLILSATCFNFSVVMQSNG